MTFGDRTFNFQIYFLFLLSYEENNLILEIKFMNLDMIDNHTTTVHP